MMGNIKNFVINKSHILFKSNENILSIPFDNKGFFLSENAQKVYDQIKDLPHLYVAWTDCVNGFFYIGKSYQPGGRWKRQHAYHLGTLAHHLLGTLRDDDQNHQHWIDSWLDVNTLILGNNNHNIKVTQRGKNLFYTI